MLNRNAGHHGALRVSVDVGGTFTDVAVSLRPPNSAFIREYEMLAESASINVRGDRANFPPKGAYGDENGTKSHYQSFEDGSMPAAK